MTRITVLAGAAAAIIVIGLALANAAPRPGASDDAIAIRLAPAAAL